MNSLILLSILLSVALGLARGLDLAFGTDAVTGLCTVGSVWWRYAALGAVVLAAVLIGRHCAGKAETVRSRQPLAGVLAFAGAVWQALAALLLLSSLARALYLPKPENGRTLCAAGLAALCLCLCWELPHAAVLAVGAAAEPALLPELFAALALCCVGALGGVCAAACARRPE